MTATPGSTAAQLGLPEPSHDSEIETFVDLVGPVEAERAWLTACAAAGHPRPGRPLTLEQLKDVAEHLAEQPGICGVFGRSMAIRIRTYLALSTLGTTR